MTANRLVRISLHVIALTFVAGCEVRAPKGNSSDTRQAAAGPGSTPTIDFPAFLGQRADKLYDALRLHGLLDDKHDLKAAGIELVTANGGHVDTIFLFFDGQEHRYRGPLFDGITPDATRQQIIARLGPPDEANAEVGWIKYASCWSRRPISTSR
jgi:hypothetical protein